MQEDLFEETETITEVSDPKFPEVILHNRTKH